jgi:hypothetical protein
MRPAASVGRRARTRAFSNSISLGAIAAIVGRAHDDDRLIVQKSIIEINECSLHRDFPCFDLVKACVGPQVVQNLDPRYFGTRRA